MDDAAKTARCDRAWEELYVTSLLMKKAWEIEVASVGLTLPQALVLHCLEKTPQAPTLGELAQMMYREAQGVSALISRMEAEGLVAKKRYPNGGNQVMVSMTDKGRKACRRQLSQQAVKSITRSLSNRELNALHTICDKIRLESIRLIKDMRPNPYDALLE